MTAPCVSACTPWAADLGECTPCASLNLDAELVTAKLATATDYLYEASNRKFAGSCTETERPNNPLLACGCYARGGRGLNRYPTWKPRGQPLTSVLEILVGDGTTAVPLASEHYRVDDWTRIVRLRVNDENPGWPCCQPMDVEVGEEGTWSVRYTYGRPPPQLGVDAVRSLACQLVLACTTPEKCGLSPRTTQASRAGITVQLNKMDLAALTEVALFLDAYNPTRTRGRMRVYTPDTMAGGQRTGT